MYLISHYLVDITTANATEHVNLVKRLNSTDLKRSNLILDVTNQEVVKCRDYFIDGELAPRDFDIIFKHFESAFGVNKPNPVNTPIPETITVG
jgi:hypothetical protein